MQLDLTITVGQIRNALAEANVLDLNDKDIPGTRGLRFRDVDIDDSEAADELPSSYFEPDEDEYRQPLDTRLLRDFVEAVADGDRWTAAGLAGRMFDDREQAAVEQAISRVRA